MKTLKYTCAKCGGRKYETDNFRATGGFLAKIFDVQSRKYSTVTCQKCRFTEMYKADTSMLGNIFDFFTN